MLALLLVAATAVPYLVSDRTILTPITPQKNVVTASAVVQAVGVSPQGRRLAFWSESPDGPITSCFAQQFSADGAAETGATRVFDLQPDDEERVYSRSGAVLWLDENDALLLIAAYQAKKGNQLLVQHWRRGKLSDPALVSNATETGLWESLVRLPSGEICAVWQEQKRAFSISARRITPEGKPAGTIMKLQKVFDLSTPGAVCAAATEQGLCLAWSELHVREPVVYFAQFDRHGVRIGDPQRVFDAGADDPHIVIRNGQPVVQALTAREHMVILRPIGGEVTTVPIGSRIGGMRVAVNSAGELAFAWINGNDVWIRAGDNEQRIATNIETGFLSLDPNGATSWRVHFRQLPEKPPRPYLWLTHADYNEKSAS